MICGHLVQWRPGLSRSLLLTNLPLLSRRLQLPVPLGVDLPLTPSEHFLRRDVANRAVVRIRQFRLSANRFRTQKLQLCRDLLAVPPTRRSRFS